jgi:DNA polymerase III alpha subunit
VRQKWIWTLLSGRAPEPSLPDIDLDVESERRLEVYDAIIKRFGRELTAVTGMPETYRARHALRSLSSSAC